MPRQQFPYGTPEEVVAATRRAILELGGGGGYLLAPSHNIQAFAPPENVIALLEAAFTYGHYPLKKNQRTMLTLPWVQSHQACGGSPA
ncbi:MAG: uroporphyrinogen decarboxylase family protein [Bacillota bacterium]